MRTQTFKTTVVSGTTSELRDELIASQHPTTDAGDAVHVDADYLFDISVDDGITTEVRATCKELIANFSDSMLFIFTS